MIVNVWSRKTQFFPYQESCTLNYSYLYTKNWFITEFFTPQIFSYVFNAENPRLKIMAVPFKKVNLNKSYLKYDDKKSLKRNFV